MENTELNRAQDKRKQEMKNCNFAQISNENPLDH